MLPSQAYQVPGVRKERVKIDEKAIFKAVSDVFMIKQSDIFKETKSPSCAHPRMTAIKFYAELITHDLDEVALRFRKSKETVRYALRTVQGWEDTDRRFRERVSRIREKICYE